MSNLQIRPYILTVATAIIVAAILYSGVLLKSNQNVVTSSRLSYLTQQINVQELSKSLGTLQYGVNQYIIYRNQSALDTVRLFEKDFQLQANKLYQLSKLIPEIKKPAAVIYSSFPETITQIEVRLKRLPPKITLKEAIAIFEGNSNGFNRYWIAMDQIRAFQIKSIKNSTNQTIVAGYQSWRYSIAGIVFMLAVVLVGYLQFKKIYKKQAIAEANEKASEAKRKENEKLLQAVIDNCPVNIFLKDTSSRYTLVNKNLIQALKLEYKDFIGKTQMEAFGYLHPEFVLESEDEVLKEGKVQESKQWFNVDGQSKCFSTTKFPLFTGQGAIFGLGGISTDITEQNKYEVELLKARETSEAAKNSQQLFLANMSHEIRTPMNGVIGMSNLLEATPLNEDQKDYVNVIKQSSNILMLLINDILDVSKMQAGMLRLEKIPFEVRESVKHIYLSYKPLADEMGIYLNCHVDPLIPEYLLGDPLRLNQIISNLVNNAIKFTVQGGVSVDVGTFETESGSFELKIVVADTGIGIPADKTEAVFKSFTQSSSSTTRKYGGTGLGLAIVKELVELQNGTINLVTELNVGSTFTVVIPFEKAVAEKNQLRQSIQLQKFSSLKNKKVLVVEDNLINQKVARQILLNADLGVVDIADNGFIALEMLQNVAYDAVLMDLQMPEIDGLETSRRIRNELKLTLPIIALTASVLTENQEICFDAGMNDYITKPFLPSELLHKLSVLLQ